MDFNTVAYAQSDLLYVRLKNARTMWKSLHSPRIVRQGQGPREDINQWTVFQWTELLVTIGPWTIYCPLIFGAADGFDGIRLWVVTKAVQC